MPDILTVDEPTDILHPGLYPYRLTNNGWMQVTDSNGDVVFIPPELAQELLAQVIPSVSMTKNMTEPLQPTKPQ